jgi:Tfp pilus assembly protein PilF
MTFIKSVSSCSLFLLLAGCQLLPSEQVAESPQSAAPELAAESQAAVIVLPNPYLQNRPAVAAAARSRYQQALDALARENWSQAESELQWLTENYPALSGPYLNLAMLYQATAQFDQAESAFQQAIAVNSNNVSAYNQYGIFLRQQGQFDAAEQQYLQSLQAWPDYAEGHLNLAILYDLYMGKFELALQHYQRYQALSAEPDRQVSGWIIDTERRLKKQQQALANN